MDKALFPFNQFQKGFFVFVVRTRWSSLGFNKDCLQAGIDVNREFKTLI